MATIADKSKIDTTQIPIMIKKASFEGIPEYSYTALNAPSSKTCVFEAIAINGPMVAIPITSVKAVTIMMSCIFKMPSFC